MLTTITSNSAMLFDGVMTTVVVSGAALLMGCPLGFLLAWGAMSRHRPISLACGIYRSFWRGTPILVQLLMVFYLLPLFGVTLPPVAAAAIALALNTAAFQGEIYRAGLLAVPPGQVEAARLLGLNRHDILFRIEAPQAIRLMLPALTGEALALVKNSSLVSVIAVTEITRRSQQIAATTFRPLEAYGTALFAYLAIAAVLAGGSLWLEQRFALSEVKP